MADRDLLQLLYVTPGVVLVLGWPAAAPPRPASRSRRHRPSDEQLAVVDCLPRRRARLQAPALARRSADAHRQPDVAAALGCWRCSRKRALIRCRRRCRARPLVGRLGRVGAAGVDATAAGCRQSSDRPAGPRTATNPQQASQVSQARLAWLRRHAEPVLLPFTRRRRTAALDRASPGVRLLGPLAVRVDGRLEDGAAVPSTLFVLEWRGRTVRAGWGGVLPLSGRITLQVRRSATAIAAFVEPDDIVLPVDGIPLRLHDAFATAAGRGTDGWAMNPRPTVRATPLRATRCAGSFQLPLRISACVRRRTSTFGDAADAELDSAAAWLRVDHAAVLNGPRSLTRTTTLAAVLRVAHHGVAGQRHGLVRRRHRVHVVDLAGGGAAAVKGPAVPGGDAGLGDRRILRERRVSSPLIS